MAIAIVYMLLFNCSYYRSNSEREGILMSSMHDYCRAFEDKTVPFS